MARVTLDREVDSYRLGKLYTLAEVARFAGMTATTVRRWLLGYQAPGHQMEPVLGSKDRGGPGVPAVSFLELAEILVVAAFRRGGPGVRPVKLERLRRAHEFARKRFRLSHPFASLELREIGGQILHEFATREPGGAALALNLNGQWILPRMVQKTLGDFDFEEDRLAVRIHPAGRTRPVVIDPRLAAGRPTIAGSGVSVERVFQRFEAGDSIEFLAEDFELDPAAIEEAIRFAKAA